MSTWRMVLRLVRGELGLTLIFGGLVVLFYGLPLAPGLVMRSFFDGLSAGDRSPAVLWLPLALLVIASLAENTSLVIGSVADNALQLLYRTRLTRNVLQQVLHQPGARPLPASTGDAISRLRDDGKAVALGLTWVLDPIAQVLIGAFAVAALAQVDATLTATVLLPLLVVIVIARLSNARIRRYRRAAQQSIGDVTGLLGEVFGSALAVQVAGAERAVVDHLRALNEARRRATLADRLFSKIVESAGGNVANLGTALLLLLVAQAVHDGRFTIGDFALFVAFIGWLTRIGGFFGTFMANYRQMEVSLQRLLQLVPNSPRAALVEPAPLYVRERLPPPAPAPGASNPPLHDLVAEHVSFTYPGSARGIHDITLRLPRGTFTVITGRVGSGKTTLLRVLLGLLPMDGGQVCWNGQRIDPATFLTPPRCAYTSQAPRLVSESVRDNILLGQSEDLVDLNASLRAAVFEDDLPRLENGLDTLVGPRGVKLSGGQVQRVAAARMLARSAELLVIDDLSSALDVETERELWRRLLAQPELTCLAVSHRQAPLRRADQIVLLDEGHAVDCGTLDELLARSARLRELWAHADDPTVAV